MLGFAMEGRPHVSAWPQDATADLREKPKIRFTVDPPQGRLREVLAEVDWHLVDLDHASVGRVRLILTEILARSTGRDEQIRIEIFVLSGGIRIELTGASLAVPANRGSQPDDESSFPSWLLAELVDRWGIDHRKQGRSIWLLLDRP
jgi:hypothetical protein